MNKGILVKKIKVRKDQIVYFQIKLPSNTVRVTGVKVSSNKNDIINQEC
jgi:hypothetical protein